jgi:mannose-6-phosphate isomerase-like protein (cupin superfamily)
MIHQLVNPAELAATIDEKYFNTVISELNDHVVRMGMMTEPYPWHYHPNSDETFIGVEGVVIIETAEQIFELGAGMVVTIPKDVPHTTRPQGERSVNLTVEKAEMETVLTK